MSRRNFLISLVASLLVVEIFWVAVGNNLVGSLLSWLLPGHGYSGLVVNLHIFSAIALTLLLWWLVFKCFVRLVRHAQGRRDENQTGPK